MSRNGRDDERKQWLQAAVFGALGTEFVVVIFGAFLLGQWLDKYFDLAPWGVVISVMLGLVLTSVHIYVMTKRFVDAEENDD